jgi:small subunit ribosomal protein S6
MIYCFKPTLDPDSVEATIGVIEGYINNLGGKVLKNDKLGRKKLAYEVRRFKDGFYLSTFFQLDPDKIKNLRRNIKLNENVIRELIIKIEKPEKLEFATAGASDSSGSDKK